MFSGGFQGLVIATGAIAAATGSPDTSASARPMAEITRVFFDWDSLEVGRDASATLDDIAEALLQKDAGAVSIVGYSDRSGSATANLRASLVRATAVREYLVARGVSADRLKILAKGEEGALVPTADGVREPQNRRVEIRK